MNKKIISIIGFDGCGKDTLGHILKTEYELMNKKVRMVKNAEDLIGFVCLFCGIDTSEYDTLKNNGYIFNGKSIRQWTIYFAEELFKPLFGYDFFANMCTDKIIKDLESDIFIKTDDRFLCEFESMRKFENVQYILLYRNQFEYEYFSNKIDSYEKHLPAEKHRTYYANIKQFINTVDQNNVIIIKNNLDLKHLEHEAKQFISLMEGV